MPNHLNDYLANERTFLAWIRTSIGIMAFGFVVEKFGLFVKQLSYVFALNPQHPNPHLLTHPWISSPVLGIALIGFGLLIVLLAFINYRKIQKQIQTEKFDHPSFLTLLLTLAILCIGIILMIYLIGSA